MTLPDCLRRDGYGEIFVAGHRVTLYHIVQAYRNAGSAEALAAVYPTLPPSLVQQVFAFCDANQPEVERYIAETYAEIERQAAAPARGPTLAELTRRLDAKHPSASA